MANNIDDNNSEEIKNSYEANYQQDQVSALENNAPQLRNPASRAMNKKAVIFLIVASLCVIGLTTFVFQQLWGGAEEQKIEQSETVTVPDLPQDPHQTMASDASIPVSLAENNPTPAKASEQNLSLPKSDYSEAINTSYYPNPVMSPAPQDVPQVGKVTDSLDMRKENIPFVEEGTGTEAVSRAAVRTLPNRDKLLVQGTYLRCVLETKIISDVPGFTSCIITEPVYSANGQFPLIPKGSKVMGQYGSSNPISPRLSVIWDRVITPDGVDITLRSPGVDNLGAAGHVGDFRTHWQSRLASALLISMMSDAFKYAAAEHGPSSSEVTDGGTKFTNPYESETADTLKQYAINQLERNSARPNTVTINQGTLINIYTAQDIDFSSIMP